MAWEIKINLGGRESITVDKKEDTMKKAKKRIQLIFKKGLVVESKTHYSYYSPKIINWAEAGKKNERN